MSTIVSDPMVGRVIDRRYRIDARLATGGMATVYTAHDTRLDRRVALKVMHSHLASDETFVGRFIREARSAAMLSHPNVVGVYDQGDDDGVVYLAMEHVAGRTLREVLRERGQLQPREALEVLERILSALGAAHAAGLVHRDVKPENVLISDEGRVKVADFGLARAISASNHTRTTGIIIGTVAYLAPEQVEQGTANARSDVYSAGVLLYEMLVGEVPFTADTPLAVAYKHVHEDVPAPSARADVPIELDDLVTQATGRNPAARPDDASALLAEVTACRRQLPDDIAPPFDAPLQPKWEEGATLVIGRPGPPAAPSAPPGEHAQPADDAPAPLSPQTRKKRRRKGVLAFVLVLLLALGAGAGGWWYGIGRWTETPELTGVTFAAAKAKAEKEGFSVERRQAHHEAIDKGDVASARPGEGERVLRGSTITLVVSRGPERHDVPKLVGKSEKDARAALAEASLAVGEVTRRFSDEVDKGDVMAVKPEAGTALKRDARVDLVISKGEAPVSVPNVRGLSAGAAKQKLGSAGLKVATSKQAHKTVKKGDVLTQSPAAGEERAKGTTVSITVSTGPPMVPVPEVTEMSAKAATKKLRAAGFQVETNRIPGGGSTVLQQKPGGGKARYGSVVKLWVF